MITLASVLVLLITVWLLIQTRPVQNWLIDKVTANLSKDLKTKINIDRVDFSLFNKMHLLGVLIEDRQKDTILSAGDITVNITDWFFFKKNIELKYISLKDAYINLQRTDSVWRHQFLLDYFSTPASTKKKKNKAINIAFKEIDLQNIRVKQQDGWLGQDMNVSLASLNTNSRNVDFNKKIIDIQSLHINKPYFALRAYKGNKPRDTIEKAPPVIATDSLQLDWNANKWLILADKVSIKDGTFKNDNSLSPLASEGFDGKHIAFSKIDADFKSVKWELDTITATIDLKTIERSGFEVKRLLANAKVTPKEMTFRNLDLRTNDSYLSDYFSMKFSQFSDMSDFINKVKMEARFNNTNINSNDIAYFAPALKTWKKKIKLNGIISGPVAALEGVGLDIRAGNNTYFLGDATLTGLPDINSTYMYIKANEFKTIYSDAVAFVPTLKKIQSPNLAKLQYIVFNGNFTGFTNDFVTYGNIKTALGNVKADVNMKLRKAGYPIYSGNINTANFNLGALLNDSRLGYVSMNTKLKGAGFKPNTGNIALEANIKYIDYNQYRYQNIKVDGDLNKKVFDGSLAVHDPNARLTLNGLVNFSKKLPEFNFSANIDSINFKKLNLYKDDLAMRGKINAQFTGNSIDDFLGHVQFTDAQLIKDGNPLSFDFLTVNSSIVDGEKVLNISSNEFVANLIGKFNIRDLPNSVTMFLSRYYPSYIKKPAKTPANQSFTFNITTSNFDYLAAIIDSSLYGFSNSRVSGSINTATNNLTLDVDVPYFKYKQFAFSNIAVDAKGDYDSLTLYGSASNIGIGDSMKIQLATFDVRAHNDRSYVRIYSGGNKTVDQARLNAFVNTYSDGVSVEFDPSSIIINGKTWVIADNGTLEFRKNSPARGELVLRESNQQIQIHTLPSDVGSWNDIAVALTNINLGDIAPYFMPNNRLEGLVTANVLIENPGKNMKISSRDFIGRGIRLDNDSLGDINANIVYDALQQELTVDGRTLGSEQKSLAYNIHLYLKDKDSQLKNVIALKANRFDLKYINRFLGFLFSDMTGEITGDFELRGPLKSITVVGSGRLLNAGLRVNFTQCYYKIQDREIVLTENEINLDGIVLQDTVTKNPVYITGSILHNAFQNMFYDITVSTRKPGTRDAGNNRPVQVLKTTYKDNKLFYGDVKATGSFVLAGTQDNTYMGISAIASDKEESVFTIASAESRAGKMPDWLVERKYGTEVSDSVYKPKTASNIKYELDITANPKVLMKFVMDDLTGDEIKGRGAGTLNIQSGTNLPLSIRGRFDIEEGSYNYTFQSFFKKPFEIRKGTENYIAWNGDPLKATINFQAQYKAEKVSFAPLAGTTIDQSYANTRENVYVLASLTGELFKPKFKFSLELDPNSRFANDFNVANALRQIEGSQSGQGENTNSEITRQVTYLIVFNSFAPPQSSVSNIGIGAAVNELTYNTISSLSGLFFNEINKKLNSALAGILGMDVSVVFSGSVYNRNVLYSNSNFNLNQANLSGAILLPLFKDRLVISLGSTLEVPFQSAQSTIQQTVQFLPDVTAEWLVNPSGTIRLTLFYRENLDYLTTASSGAAKLRRTGGGISFKREFNNFKDIFINQRKRAERDTIKPAAVQPVDTTKVIAPVTTEKKEDVLKPQP